MPLYLLERAIARFNGREGASEYPGRDVPCTQLLTPYLPIWEHSNGDADIKIHKEQLNFEDMRLLSLFRPLLLLSHSGYSLSVSSVKRCRKGAPVRCI